jgi:hypothetical protein
MSGTLLLQEMQDYVARWDEQQDRRAIFLNCYALMTENMLNALDKREFYDSVWVNALLEHFAEYYFQALAAYEQDPRTAPRVWNIAFAAAKNQQVNVIAKLLLGVNAHINYDLVFAIADMLAPEWENLSAAQRELRYQDHCHVNAIIAKTIDAVQDQVIERHNTRYALVDDLLGSLDEWAISKLIAQWREQVWKYAMRWLAVTDDAERAVLKLQVEEDSIRIAETLLGVDNLTNWFKPLRDSI